MKKWWRHAETFPNALKQGPRQGCVFPLFSPDSDDRLIEPKFTQVCYFIVVIHEVWAFGQYCLPKVSNGFKKDGYSIRSSYRK